MQHDPNMGFVDDDAGDILTGTDKGNGADSIWPTLSNLPSSLPQAPSLPTELAPKPLQSWLCDAADRAQIPLEFIAAPAIVALSSVLGRSIGIYPKKHDDWLVTPNLWGALVGRPGVLKSPAIAEALKPLRRLSAEAQEEFKITATNAQAGADIIKAEISALQGRAKKDAGKNDKSNQEATQADLANLYRSAESAEVHEKRYIVNDTTTEKLGELLNQNPRGLLLIRDELTGWLRSMDKMGRENDREFYLEAWHGSGGFDVDRIGRGTTHIPELCLSVFGSIQPGKMKHYVQGALHGGFADDGLLQRLQMVVWPEIDSPWVNVDRSPDISARDKVAEIFRALDTANPSDFGAEIHDEAIPAMRFDPDAQELFYEWWTELEQRLRSSEMEGTPAFESHIAKYRSLMPSLALVFHLTSVVSGEARGPVSLDAAKLASTWCEFLEKHAKKIYAPELNADLTAAHDLIEKIRAGVIEEGTKIREIYRRQWSGLNTPETVWDGLRVLELHSLVKVEHVQTEGRPADIIHIHPDLLAGA